MGAGGKIVGGKTGARLRGVARTGKLILRARGVHARASGGRAVRAGASDGRRVHVGASGGRWIHAGADSGRPLVPDGRVVAAVVVVGALCFSLWLCKALAPVLGRRAAATPGLPLLCRGLLRLGVFWYGMLLGSGLQAAAATGTGAGFSWIRVACGGKRLGRGRGSGHEGLKRWTAVLTDWSVTLNRSGRWVWGSLLRRSLRRGGGQSKLQLLLQRHKLRINSLLGDAIIHGWYVVVVVVRCIRHGILGLCGLILACEVVGKGILALELRASLTRFVVDVEHVHVDVLLSQVVS